MTPAGFDSLYEYYGTQDVLPTHGAFKSGEEVGAYTRARAAFFTEKLKLPVALFDGAPLLEFGPDSGENSLAFAKWGARLTLVEPNGRAHSAIRSYFQKFKLEAALTRLVQSDVVNFASEEPFDVIDAEGFVYTIETRQWLDAFAKLLRPGGFAVVSYYEKRGCFLELATKALHNGAVRLMGWPSIAAARRLYEKKWATIPHTRKFESWVMDVLENPFVRLTHFVDPYSLCVAAQKCGFSLYASWPLYDDPLSIYWHKRRLSDDERLESIKEHVGRSTLSFMGGSKLYLSAANSDLQRLETGADWVLGALDACIDDATVVPEVARRVASLMNYVKAAPLIEQPGERERFIALLSAVARAFEMLASKDVEGLCHLTSSDPGFMNTWGLPAHFAVFERCDR